MNTKTIKSRTEVFSVPSTTVRVCFLNNPEEFKTLQENKERPLLSSEPMGEPYKYFTFTKISKNRQTLNKDHIHDIYRSPISKNSYCTVKFYLPSLVC